MRSVPHILLHCRQTSVCTSDRRKVEDCLLKKVRGEYLVGKYEENKADLHDRYVDDISYGSRTQSTPNVSKRKGGGRGKNDLHSRLVER